MHGSRTTGTSERSSAITKAAEWASLASGLTWALYTGLSAYVALRKGRSNSFALLGVLTGVTLVFTFSTWRCPLFGERSAT